MELKGLRIGKHKIKGNRKRKASDIAPQFRANTGRYSKYKNKKVLVDGRWFDSKKEADVYVQLKMLEEAGAISNLEVQPCYEFTMAGGRPVQYPPVSVVRNGKSYQRNGKRLRYYADFRYREPDGTQVVVDVKGYDTDVSRLKRALVWSQFGVEVQIV